MINLTESIICELPVSAFLIASVVKEIFSVKADKKLKFAEGVELDGKEYQHVKYNVVENEILELDKTFDAPEVVIPSAEE